MGIFVVGTYVAIAYCTSQNATPCTLLWEVETDKVGTITDYPEMSG